MASPSKRARRAGWWIAALLVLAPLIIVYASQPSGDRVRVSIGESHVQAEVARTTLEHSRGLMFRREMARDQGMLFVFDEAAPRSFWMKNTFIPLSIAFIDSDKRILNLHDMTPNNSEKTYKSSGPARYALEVNMGWFDEHHVHPGDQVQFQLPEVEAR